ncbi:hypothetical protein R69746_05630 [Paraburkholderia aspalathi]|nr:hypothetical protein R69746_05630 [Paraburkholderia aspalathi]
MSDYAWAVIENIVIMVLVSIGIYWTATGWPLALLIFINVPRSA